MRDTQMIGTKPLNFSIPAEHFSAMNLYARRQGMSLRDLMAHLVESYLDAMKATPAA